MAYTGPSVAEHVEREEASQSPATLEVLDVPINVSIAELKVLKPKIVLLNDEL